MKIALRLAPSAALLCAAVLATRITGSRLIAATIMALGIHLAVRDRVRAALVSTIRVGLFAAVVLALGSVNGRADWSLAARTVAVFLFSTTACRLVPWKSAASRLSGRSRLYTLWLFLLLVRHFAEILAGETRRTLQARALCVRGILGRSGFSSLGWAVVSIFRRALARTERFYAAQVLSGIVQ